MNVRLVHPLVNELLSRLPSWLLYANGAECADRQVETVINIDKAYEEAIHDHVQSLRSSP